MGACGPRPGGDVGDQLSDHLRDVAYFIKQDRLAHERWYLTTDNDSHWYVVPLARRGEWEAWCEIDPDDERAWTPPEFAVVVGGSPGLVTFTNPTVGS